MQLTFWRRSGTTFTAVPIATLHASARGDYADRKMAVTDVCSLPTGATLAATNRRTLLVIDKLKVVKMLDNLERPLLKLAPLGGRKFAAVAAGEMVELYIAERSGDDVIAGALQILREHYKGPSAR